MTTHAIQKDLSALPKPLYGTRAGIFHLLQQQAAAPIFYEDDRVDIQIAQTVAPPAPPVPPRETDPGAFPEQVLAVAPKPLPNKSRFRETQRVAKGTSARFSARSQSPAKTAVQTERLRQPITPATQAWMSPAAQAVRHGKWTANTPTEPSPGRSLRPLPTPITNQDVAALFTEDHFDFEVAS